MSVAADLPTPATERRKAAIDPAVVQGIRQASRESHVDFGYLMAEAQQESGFQPDAKAATSSATGLYQFTDATWLDMVRLHGAQHGVGQLAEQITTNAAGHSVVADPSAREHILSLRKDPALSASLAAELTKS
ncbi:MAG: transglycosylase SLT domain-containing protein, partial [Alphaproteobacteria bacterium]|nr:transglycosylase SLT domain-containing protein [Alphaproteobacteria bacterium]